jgi:hypothetical protein
MFRALMHKYERMWLHKTTGRDPGEQQLIMHNKKPARTRGAAEPFMKTIHPLVTMSTQLREKKNGSTQQRPHVTTHQ